MQIIKASSHNPDENVINKIVSSLSCGKVVIFPTETVYTFAVDATNKKAVKNVYKLKGRDYDKPMHVVVDSLESASPYVVITPKAKILADKFLPGPLTLVLKKIPGKLPDMLTSGLATLGIRIPNLKICNAVSKRFTKPYTTTSANKSGGENTYTVESVLEQLSEDDIKMIDLVIDVGPLPKLKPSTLVDVSGKKINIIREGPIPESEIVHALKSGVT